jgi:hypothetical protein
VILMQKIKNSRTPTRRIVVLLLFIVLTLSIVPVYALTLNPGESPSATQTIAKGDPVYIRGIASGHPQVGLQVWIIGNNYARVSTISVNADSSYEFELRASDTQNMAAGQYFVLIQHPMMNGQFDIVYNAGTGQVINMQKGNGMSIFTLTGAGGLQGPAAASALLQAVADQNIDDMFTTVSFTVGEPATLIDPIGEHTVGERFTITGSTSLAVGDDLLVDIYSDAFQPTSKGQPNAFSGTSGMVKVTSGTGRFNRWSYDVDASAFSPGTYSVKVSAVLQPVTDSTTFRIVEYRAPAPTPATFTATQIPAQTVTHTPAPTTWKSPLPVWAVLASLLAAAVLTCRLVRDKL